MRHRAGQSRRASVLEADGKPLRSSVVVSCVCVFI
jgi:hypothetical protein